ncbi:disease resistance protein (TIR-NBS-LRR class) [Trifolium pratense]|uniref:Disease resistance protein (TIR-NBS-LRR class) n=1 Tax=Trifolium pratense TaxID=57577 RepID=A0A2K3LZM7_TRIPR|nr:disease resistance protein (TIR-NBS-LRR class) [Trifolium pratense]
MVSSKVKYLRLDECKLKDDSLPIILKLFANLTHLDLSLSNFTILPECIKEHQSLISLNLDDCTRLQEIRGIPPNLKFLSALNCELLSSSCTSMLLNQELHEVGGTIFCLPGKRIPEWFELQSRGWSFSFWIRNRLPSISLLYTTESMINKSCLGRFCLPVAQLYINGRECTFDDPLKDVLINPLRFRKSQMHIFKQESSMDDIQFSDPYKKRELDDDDDDVFYDVDDVLDDDDHKTTHCNA